MLTVVNEYTRACLPIRIERRITNHDVLYVLSELLLELRIPQHTTSGKGPEFVATAVRSWLTDLGVKTLFIEPSSHARERLDRVVHRHAA